MKIKEAVSHGTELLEKAGICEAKIDAFLLFEAVTGISRAEFFLNPEKELSPELIEKYNKFIKRRSLHEPCQYILGSCWFYGLEFSVNENVLIPRQDTEVLVEEALNCVPENASVLDLCTGSGAIAVAMKAARPDLTVLAVDLSEAALNVAKQNAEQNGVDVRFLRSDLFAAIDPSEKFDLIVSNPPYISNTEYEFLMPEVKEFEPPLALVAGEEGLDIYRRLVAEAPEHLKENGVLLVEIGCSQGGPVSELFREAGFRNLKVLKDLAGLDRVVFGRCVLVSQ